MGLRGVWSSNAVPVMLQSLESVVMRNSEGLVLVINTDEQNRSDFVLLLEREKLLFIRSCDQTDAHHLD